MSPGDQLPGMTDDAAFVEAVRALGPAPTREIADAVGCTRRAAEYRLRKLYAEGRVDSERVGTSLIWKPPDNATAVDPVG